MLHFDLWWRGQNIALDPGTYSYNAAPPWDNPLARTMHHNTVTVDGRDQMQRVGRFMWLPWLTGICTERVASASGHLAYWQGEHDGYPSVSYRRCLIRLADDVWVVADALDSETDHDYRLHWLLSDLPYVRQDDSIVLHSPAGDYQVCCRAQTADVAVSLVRADAESALGWQARRYHSKTPALSLALETRSQSERFIGVFSPKGCSVTSDTDGVTIQFDDRAATFAWNAGRSGAIFSHIAITGSVVDSLNLTKQILS